MKTLKTELISYFEQLDSDVQFSYKEVQKDIRKGTIHTLRISLKRLQAFTQMWSAIDPHFPDKASLKRFQTLFMEAGRLRDLQIENSLLLAKEDMLELNHKTSEQIAKRIKEQQRVFREFEEAFSMAGLKETCKLIRSHLEHITLCHLRVGLRKYFRDLLSALSIYAREGMRSKKRLHELQNRIKEAQYNLIAIDSAASHFNLPMDLLQPLETLQHKLGIWHDHCITVDQSKNLWNIPQSLRRRLRLDESRYLKDIRSFLAKLPDLCECLWQEMDAMLAPPEMAEKVENKIKELN